MEITQIYAVAAGGALAFLVIVKLWLSITRILRFQTSGFLLKHVVYPYLLRRHRCIGPWTRGSVLLHVFYIAAVIFCNSFRVDSLTQASIRAGKMALINSIPLYLGFHLGFIADVLGISLRVFSRLHGSIAFISTALGLFHAVVSMASGPNSLHDGTRRTYGLAVSHLTV